MKYLYRGMEHAEEGTCAVILLWHAAVCHLSKTCADLLSGESGVIVDSGQSWRATYLLAALTYD